MRNLLEEFVLPKVNEYEIKFDTGKPEKGLKRVREELQCIGSQVKKLCVAEEDLWMDSMNIGPYMLQCSKYFSASLKERNLRNIPFRNLESIRPLLLEIESLKIYLGDEVYYESSIDIQLPKLKELELDVFNDEHDEWVEIKKKHFLRKTFPRLEKAVIHLSYIDNDIKIFLKNNAQLKYLLISTVANQHIIKAISKKATNLEQLVLFAPFDDEVDLLPLNENEKLTKLVLIRSNCGVELFPKIKKVHQMRSLRSLMLISGRRKRESVDPGAYVDWCRRMPKLEHFCSDFVWNQTTIIEFVKHGRHLRTFCIRENVSWELITVNFIETMAEARKSIFENGSNGIVPLELIICSRPRLLIPIIELNAKMAKYVTVSFLWSSAEKYFDPASLTEEWYSDSVQPIERNGFICFAGS